MHLNIVQTVIMVGGFAASDWLFSSVRTELEKMGLTVYRPDGHVYVPQSLSPTDLGS